jgi:6,7-dimethyl-8-ribityllumazine synthase
MQRKEFNTEIPDGTKLKVGIVIADFNSDITGALLEGALDTLRVARVSEANITVRHVPGGFELPLGCLRVIKEKKPDAVIALGCVIKGETKHDEYIAQAAAQGIMRVQLDTGIPIAFGVLTPNTLEQAKARAEGKTNHGALAAVAALKMALGFLRNP